MSGTHAPAARTLWTLTGSASTTLAASTNPASPQASISLVGR